MDGDKSISGSGFDVCIVGFFGRFCFLDCSNCDIVRFEKLREGDEFLVRCYCFFEFFEIISDNFVSIGNRESVRFGFGVVLYDDGKVG